MKQKMPTPKGLNSRSMLNPFQGWVFNSSQPLVLRGASPEATQIHPIQGWCKAMSKDM